MSDSPHPHANERSGALAQLWSETRAILDLVLDFSFKRYVTPRLVRVLYALSLLAALLSALAWMGSGFRDGILHGLFTLLTGPVAFMLYVLCARVVMELILTVFRIAEQLEKLPSTREVGRAEPPTVPDSGSKR